ncbi:MAG: hypothetical protein AAGD23_01355 [Pseudomonadota bacterium]
MRRNADDVLSDLRRLGAGVGGILDVLRELSEGRIGGDQHTIMNYSDENWEIHRAIGVLSYDVSDTSRVMGEKMRELADMRSGLRQSVIDFVNGWHLSALTQDSDGFPGLADDIGRLNAIIGDIESQLQQVEVR